MQADIRNRIAISGLLQGVLLLLAHEAIANAWSVAESMSVRLAWYAAVVAAPLAYQMLTPTAATRWLVIFVAGLSAMFAVLGVYSGYAIGANSDGLVFAFVVTLAATWFVALPFAQTALAGRRLYFPYARLFEFSWNNLVTLAIAAMFIGVFWLLLALWAALFKVIGISFFQDLFFHRTFVYPVTAIAFAFAVVLGRTFETAVVNVRRVLLAVYRALLPLLAGIAVLFLTALPFTGLQPLWNTGHATTLMLLLQIALVLFVNAVYQDGALAPPYPVAVRRLVEVAIILLPVYSGLCLYALGLRVGQHGWTADRVWAAILTVLMLAYALGYAYAALARSDAWMRPMARVNVAMAAALILVGLAVNSPLLDPKTIAIRSQVARLLANRIAPDQFDYAYLRFELGEAGRRALARLIDPTALALINDPARAETIRTSATEVLARASRWDDAQNRAVTPADFAVYPSGTALDPAFLTAVGSNREALGVCANRNRDCTLLAIDLDADQRVEYVLFDYPYTVFAHGPNGWLAAGRMLSSGYANPRDALAAGRYEVKTSRWQNLHIAGREYVLIATPP